MKRVCIVLGMFVVVGATFANQLSVSMTVLTNTLNGLINGMELYSSLLEVDDKEIVTDYYFTETTFVSEQRPLDLPDAVFEYPLYEGAVIVDYTTQFIGNPYVWGGTDPVNGSDCSGFVQAIYKEFGYEISRVTATQIKDGVEVPLNELMPGDLIFFDTMRKGSVSHVGMYESDGYFIHAANSRSGVIRSKLEGYYLDTFITVRRIL